MPRPHDCLGLLGPRCEFDAEQALELDRVVFAGYVAGLRDAEWDGNVEQVRLGYTIAGRWSVSQAPYTSWDPTIIRPENRSKVLGRV